MKADIFTRTYIRCPQCSGQEGMRVDHLFGRQGKYGPWYCDECGHGIEVHIADDDTVGISSVASKRTNTLDLLVLPPQTKPLYFAINGCHFGEDHNSEYFYNEHSCPTNWLSRIEFLVYGMDDDPHGLLRFVRSVNAFDDDKGIFEIFPEMLESLEDE